MRIQNKLNMKAIRIQQYGDNSVLENVEVPIPSLSSNQVLIKLKASSVNPIDYKIRSGYLSAQMPKQFPFTLGWEGSGIVTEIGSDIIKFAVGDEVILMPNFMEGGTYAEFIAINENELMKKPKSLDFTIASTLPFSLGTAYTTLIEDAQIQEGQRLLIHGAGGAVGQMSVQIAKNKGLFVIGTATGTNIEELRELGVDSVIDYMKDDFAVQVKDLDVVLDLVGGETLAKSYSLIKKGGIIVSTVQPPDTNQLNHYNIHGKMTFTRFDSDKFSQAINWVSEGKIKVKQPDIYTLSQAKEALATVEDRKTKAKIIFQF